MQLNYRLTLKERVLYIVYRILYACDFGLIMMMCCFFLLFQYIHFQRIFLFLLQCVHQHINVRAKITCCEKENSFKFELVLESWKQLDSFFQLLCFSTLQILHFICAVFPVGTDQYVRIRHVKSDKRQKKKGVVVVQCWWFNPTRKICVGIFISLLCCQTLCIVNTTTFFLEMECKKCKKGLFISVED